MIENLNRCHEENPMAKFFGACNDCKIALDKCFRKEKIRVRTANLERARASNAYVKEKLKEHHERKAAAAREQGSN